MGRFIQLHLLTSYPPGNLNRDDLGRPKTALFGGKNRLRISSQCLKRTWRVSELFQEALGERVGLRTRRLGPRVYQDLIEGGLPEELALKSAEKIARSFGEVEGKKKLFLHKQIIHYTPLELEGVDALVVRLLQEERVPEKEDLASLQEKNGAVDVALFGRMLASDPGRSVEAAVQVAHALTVHEAVVEDDFFTAVDELNEGVKASGGSAHLGIAEFGAGLFYSYICIDRSHLEKNLQGDEELADRVIRALVEAAAKSAPTGMQNSYGSRAYASYILAERGDQQPRSLAVAFLKPVEADEVGDGELLQAARIRLESMQVKMERVYGPCARIHYCMDVSRGEGSFEELLSFLVS